MTQFSLAPGIGAVPMSAVVRIHQTGGPEVLRLEDLPVGRPGPGQVRVRVQAIGLNRAEAAFRAGQYLRTPTLPAPIGMEANEQLGKIVVTVP